MTELPNWVKAEVEACAAAEAQKAIAKELRRLIRVGDVPVSLIKIILDAASYLENPLILANNEPPRTDKDTFGRPEFGL